MNVNKAQGISHTSRDPLTSHGWDLGIDYTEKLAHNFRNSPSLIVCSEYYS